MGLWPRARRRFVCALFLALAAVPALAAERVSVSGAVAGASGRLEFVWPQPVEYDARVLFGRLLVRFSVPGDFDFSAFQDAMPQYLGDPKVVADGTVVAFPLRVPVSVRHSQDGPRISIELVDEQGLTALSTAAGPEDRPEDEAAPTDLVAAAPAAGPAETPAAPAIADPLPLETAAGPTGERTIGLRVGEHTGFSRLVFDWPSRVSYRIEQRGRRVTIDFEASAELDLTNFRRRPPVNVSEITAEPGAAGLSVILTLPEEHLVRHFLNGSHVVVDVVDDAEAARLPPSTVVAEVAPLSDDPPAPAPGAEPMPDRAPTALVTEGPLSPSGAEAPNRTWEAGAPQLTAIEPGVPSTGAQEPVPDGTGEPSGPVPGGADADLAPPGAGVLALAGRREADPADPASAVAGLRRPVVLQFDWPSGPGRAAVFRRGRHLWIAFDQPLADGVGRDIAEAVPDLAPVERLTAEAESSAAILRLNLPWAFVPELRRAERAWILDLQPRADEPQTALTLEYLTDTAEPRIRFGVDDAEEVLRVRDPELGDLLEIVPVPAAGLGLKRERRFLQFRALATYQGLAFVPLSDGFRVESGEGGVVVRDAAGLLISPGADRDRALRNNKDFESGLRLIDRDPREREVAAVHAVRALRRAPSGALFAELFLGEAGGRLSPPAAFALYREFKDLTPAGPDGDRLIDRLADRLVAAGLLDQGAQLLEDQVAHRLHGEAKVHAGTRLALIRLLDGQPVPALTALNATLPEGGFASLPPELERDRRLLRARALASLGRGAEARALIAGDDSDEALRLEAELFWAEQNWAAAAGTLEKLAPEPGRSLPLSEADGEVLLNLAAAYGLSGRRDDMIRISKRYRAALADTVWRDAFASITGTEDKAALIALGDTLAGPAGLEALEARYLAPSGTDPSAGTE